MSRTAEEFAADIVKLPTKELAAKYDGHTVTGTVNLRDAEVLHRVELRKVTFVGPFLAEDVRFEHTLDMSECEFEQGLLIDGSCIQGCLILSTAYIGPLPDEINIRTTSRTPALSATRLCVGDQATLSSLRAAGAVVLARINVGGVLMLSWADVAGDLELLNAHVGADLICRSLAETEPPTRVGGEVSMYGATVGRHVNFGGATIGGDLDLRNSDLGELDCQSSGLEPPTQVGGHVRMRGATVRGSIDLSLAQMARDLDLQNARLGGNLFCSSGASDTPTRVGGRVWMRGIAVGGSVSFCGAEIVGDLDLQNADIKNNLTHRRLQQDDPKTVTGGKVWMSGAKVGGSVHFSGAEIAGDLDLQNAQVGADLFCRSLNEAAPPTKVGGSVQMRGTTVRGRVDFQNAHIDRGVKLDGATFADITVFLGASVRNGFQAIRATFEDGLFLGRYAGGLDRDFVEAPTKTGPIDLSHTRVGGELHLAGNQIAGIADSACVTLSFATVDGTCRLPGSDTAKKLELYHAQLGEVRFGGGGLPKIAADGLSFRELELPGDDYINFLDRTDEFSEANYRKVETHLRNQGRDAEADEVYREMRRRDRREDLGPWLFAFDLWLFCPDKARRARLRDQRNARPSKPAHNGLRRLLSWPGAYFLDRTTGYGTQSYRVGLYLLFVYVLFCILFTSELSVKRKYHATVADLVQLKESGKKGEEEPQVRPSELKKEWRTSDAMAMAARVTIPLIEPAVDADWEPSGDSVFAYTEGGWKDYTSYETVAGLFRALSFVAVPLFLVSVSGFMKKRDET